MKMNRLTWALAAGTVSLSTMACQVQAPVGAGARGSDLVVAEKPQAANLVFKLKDNTLKAPKDYHVNYVYAPDWHTASIKLYRTMNGADSLVRSATVAAVTRSDEVGREGTTSFNTLEPGAGYKVDVTLTGKGPDGVDFTVASGTSANQTISAGNNTITITLKLVGGKLQPSISQPTLTTDSITAVVGTQDAYSFELLAGRRWYAGWTPGFGGTVSAADANIRVIHGIASDAAGNVYIAEEGYSYPVIRKIPANGGPTEFVAGNGAYGDGLDGQLATTQSIGAPAGLVYEAGGNRLFFADQNYKKIRYVNLTDGKMYTYAGGGATPVADASAVDRLSAQLGRVGAMAMDDNGDLYFVFIENAGEGAVRGDSCRVWRLAASTGKITLVANLAGQAVPVGFRTLAIDQANDRLFVGCTLGSGETLVRTISNAASGSPAVSSTADSLRLEDWKSITAIDFDQAGYLYAMQSGSSDKDPGTPAFDSAFPYDDAAVKLWRIPIDSATGKLRTGYTRIRIAGNGDQTPFADTSAVEAPASGPDASALRLSGCGNLALHVDRFKVGAATPAVVYFGNASEGMLTNYTENWTQVLKFISP